MAFALAAAGIGAAASIGGAMSASKSAKAANNVARDTLAAQRAFANEMTGFGQIALNTEAEIRTEIRDRNTRNDALALDTRDYERGITRQNYEEQVDLRDYLRERQGFVDSRAADLQALEIESFRRNQDLAAREREAGLNYLDRNARIAQDERNFSVEDQARNREQRLAERQFQIDELRRAQGIAQREQDISIQDRGRLIDGAADMRARVEQTLQNLGQMAPTQRFSADDITREGDIRAQEYRRAVDRAATMASSQNEAALIGSGIDASTTGAARRTQVAERLAPMYQEAYTRARNDANAYIQGLQTTTLAGQAGEIARRNAIMGELVNAIGAPLQIEARLPNLISAQGPNAGQSVGSGVYTQQLTSAGDYRAPINVGSAMVDPRVSSGVGQTMNIAAPQQEFRTSNGINTAYQQLPYTAPGTFFGQAQSAMGGNTSASAGYANSQNTLAASAASGAGRALENFGQRLGSSGAGNAVSNWWNNSNGSVAVPSNQLGTGSVDALMAVLPAAPPTPSFWGNQTY